MTIAILFFSGKEKNPCLKYIWWESALASSLEAGWQELEKFVILTNPLSHQFHLHEQSLWTDSCTHSEFYVQDGSSQISGNWEKLAAT